MSGLDCYRKRNRTVCFWMTYDERRELEARIAATGLPKGEYFIRSLLHQKIEITVGKYQSDRLSLELKRLRERMDGIDGRDESLQDVLVDCKALLAQVIQITSTHTSRHEPDEEAVK